MNNRDNGLRPKSNEIINTMVDCFGGAHGGVWFAQFRSFFNRLVIQAEAGDPDAEKIVSIAERFKRLVNLSKH